MHITSSRMNRLLRSPGAIAASILLILWQFEPLATLAQTVEVFDGAVMEVAPAGQVGYTELLTALGRDDLNTAESLLMGGADANAANQIGETPLMIAAAMGRADIVRLLLDHGADTELRSMRDDIALGNAVRYGHTGIVTQLLDAGANPNAQIDNDRQVLELAAVLGHSDMVDALIEYDVNIGSAGPAALRNAAWKGYPGIVATLILAGVDVNGVLDDDSGSALQAAANSGDLASVNLLLANGARAHAEQGAGALSSAIRNGHVEIVEVLVAAGASATADHLSSALASRNNALAHAVLVGFDAGSAAQVEFERLIISADLSGEDAVINALFDANPAAVVDDQQVRLLFRRQDKDSCDIRLWNPHSRTETAVYSSDVDCGELVFVADGRRTLFVVQDDQLHVVPLDMAGRGNTLDLPSEQIEANRVKLAKKFDSWFDDSAGGQGYLDGLQATPVAIGYLDSGELALAVHSSGPADGTHAYLYTRGGAGWALREQTSCHRFDDCMFPQLNGRKAGNWRLQRNAWHPYLRKNRFFLSKQSAPDPQGEWAGWNSKVVFDIAGQKSTILFRTSESGHDSYTYTNALSLEPAVGDRTVLFEYSGESSFADRYVLVQHSSGNSYYLYDLGSGAEQLGPLGFATWLD